MTLIARGRFEEADRCIAKAYEIEPLSSVIAHGAAFNFVVSRRSSEAIQVCLKAIEIAPDYPLLRLPLPILEMRVAFDRHCHLSLPDPVSDPDSAELDCVAS